MGINVPQSVVCEDCGETARVRACGRIEYDWPETITGGQTATVPTLTSARLTIDCQHCGVKVQDYLADNSNKRHSSPKEHARHSFGPHFRQFSAGFRKPR